MLRNPGTQGPAGPQGPTGGAGADELMEIAGADERWSTWKIHIAGAEEMLSQGRLKED